VRKEAARIENRGKRQNSGFRVKNKEKEKNKKRISNIATVTDWLRI
jgi:hypothetical protein